MIPPAADGEGFDSFAATIFPDNALGILAENSGTESGTLLDETAIVDADLAAVIAAWQVLTSEQRRQNVAIVAEGSSAATPVLTPVKLGIGTDPWGVIVTSAAAARKVAGAALPSPARAANGKRANSATTRVTTNPEQSRSGVRTSANAKLIMAADIPFGRVGKNEFSSATILAHPKSLRGRLNARELPGLMHVGDGYLSTFPPDTTLRG